MNIPKLLLGLACIAAIGLAYRAISLRQNNSPLNRNEQDLSDYKSIQPAPEVRTEKTMQSSEEIAEISNKKAEVKEPEAALSEMPMANESTAPKSQKRKKSKKARAKVVSTQTTSQSASPSSSW
jgi:hypothetical protein